MEEEKIKFLKDFMDGLAELERINNQEKDLLEKRTTVQEWLKRLAAYFLGRFAERTEQSESWQNSKIINLPAIGSNRTSILQEDDLMKNVRTRKNGSLEFRKMIKGVNYQFTSKNKEKVKQYIADLKRKMKSYLPDTKVDSSIPFCEYAEQYYHLFKESKSSESSKEEWGIALKFFKEKFPKAFRVYTAFDFQREINELAKRAPNTAKKTFNKIRAICKKAFLTGVIKINIAEIIEKPEFEEGTRRALTVMEQVKFLNQLKHEDEELQIFCLFCLVTSARREEACRYKPEHYNARNNTLFVNGTKTLNAPRTIKVTESFAQLLKKIGTGFKHTSDYYSRAAKEIFKKIGSPDLVLNCLRHTCATNMVYFGISSDYRKHIMGHSTVQTTDKVYTHIEVGVTRARMQLIYKDLYFTDY